MTSAIVLNPSLEHAVHSVEGSLGSVGDFGKNVAITGVDTALAPINPLSFLRRLYVRTLDHCDAPAFAALGQVSGYVGVGIAYMTQLAPHSFLREHSAETVTVLVTAMALDAVYELGRFAYIKHRKQAAP
jgi:hypothetical protein